MTGKLLLNGKTNKGKNYLTVKFPQSVKRASVIQVISMTYETVKAIMMTGHDLTDAVPNRKAFAERLKIAISEDGRSQETLAAEIGLSLSGFRKWLYGETEPQMSGLVRASYALKVRIEWLATGEGTMRDGEASPAPEPTIAPPATDRTATDRELMGRCFDAIGKLYQSLNIRMPLSAMGEEAADLHDDVLASGATSLDEYLVAIRIAIAQRRRALLTAPPSSKQQGSA